MLAFLDMTEVILDYMSYQIASDWAEWPISRLLVLGLSVILC